MSLSKFLYAWAVRRKKMSASWANATSINLTSGVDNVETPDDSTLDLTTKMTLSFWMRVPDGFGANQTVFSKWLRNTQNVWRIFWPTATSLSCYIASSLTDVGANRGNINMTGVTADEWHHIAWVYDGDGAANADRLKGYLDGVEQSLTFNGTIPATLLNGSSNVIAGSDDNNSLYFDGLIDEPAIIRRALTGAQITALYNSGLPEDLSDEADLEMWWRGDGDTLPAILDHAKTNNGTATAGVALSTNIPGS